MSCYGCIFKSVYQDMGASHDVCKLQNNLADAVKACDNSGNCPHHVTLEEAKTRLLSSDVAPVRHGEWIKKHRHRGGFRTVTVTDSFGEEHTGRVDTRYECDELYCSVCGKIAHEAFLNYCANCGAKMDIENSEKEIN